MNGYTVTECGVADLRARAAVHREAAARFGDHLDGTPGHARLTAHDCGEPCGVRSPDYDAGAQPGTREVDGVLVGDQPSGVDSDHMVGRARRLLGVAGGVEDRSSLRGMGTQEPVQPSVLAWREPLSGIVEDQRMGVSEQRRRETQPAVHAERERSEALVAEPGEADGVEQLVGPGGGYARCGAEHTELTTDGADGMAGYVPEEHSHLTGGMRDAVQWSATKVGDTAPRLDFEHQTEGCGLTGTGSAEECRDAAGSGFEGEVVHGGRTAAVGALVSPMA